VSGLEADGCGSADARISSPLPGQVLSGVIAVRGTAQGDDFAYYNIEIRPDFATVYIPYTRGESSVTDGTLAEVDTAIYGAGIYWIRLQVATIQGDTLETCAIPVIIQ
jgi:hypothetical protein